MIDRLRDKTAKALAIVERAGTLMQKGYQAENNTTLMGDAAIAYQAIADSCASWPALVASAGHLSKAVVEHATGEAAYFADRFDEAEQSFQRAASLARMALEPLSEESLRIEFREEHKTILAYISYYEIEALEARAYSLKQRGDIAGAAVLHAEEIEQTRAAAASPSNDIFLDGFFAGHFWYAQASLLRCRSEEARLGGNEGLAKQLASQADMAERKSVELNAQWRE